MPPIAGFGVIVPRFCSEFGYQSPPNLGMLPGALKAEDLAMTAPGVLSPALEHRQRATGGTERHINEAMREYLASRRPGQEFPATFAAWHSLAQEVQAEALRAAIDRLGRHREGGRCMGALIWQFNDAWPGMSWSLIGTDGVPKPAYFAVQEAFARLHP
jgi:beta-mannosidase